MSAAPSFQFYPQDFLVGTADMTPEEVGAYIRLLCYQWSKGGLPNDHQRCAAMSGSGGNAVASIWHKFVLCEDGKMRNARLETVRTESAKYRARQAVNGAKRWRKSQTDATAMPPLCQASPVADAEAVPNACPSTSSSLEEEYRGESKTPELDQVLEYAKSPQGNTDPEIAEIWWNQNEGRPLTAAGSWTDSKGQPIRDWRKALRGYGLTCRKNKAQYARPERNGTASPGKVRPCDIQGDTGEPSMQEIFARAKQEMEEHPCE